MEEDQTFEGETYTTQDGTIFYRHDDGIHWVNAPERALPGVELSPEELNRSAEIQDTVNADYAAVVEETVPLSYETLDGQVFYRTTDGTYWVDTPDRAAGSLNDQELQRSEEIAAIVTADQEARGGAQETAASPATVAGILLPAALVVGGVMWYLN
ncbi:hypothetical protein C3B44_01830 [Corynebacterium yudongzhengii]|uniref:Uncharacterized protein n=1 Tax=Corynebacterium yudongzhengii TaxID=2080740 RepID=A0A2U1T9T5_9CORY|nr:hypothetical protein [Corynebacterium yudongzhengii]AWB81235.1 hypothetical protein C3B44_01830 [Corynebacterium yudongzhengii]PWC02774.1 hypothetical protein DF222_00560 [Corynebacterium yudongzhengii]